MMKRRHFIQKKKENKRYEQNTELHLIKRKNNVKEKNMFGFFIKTYNKCRPFIKTM